MNKQNNKYWNNIILYSLELMKNVKILVKNFNNIPRIFLLVKKTNKNF